ncbi:MAG: helix-turn-helix transcriptional regulator [Bacillota bacterium]|nr:helix-turn-helix transcriptional regulator [Bacillota bacterium]
MDQKKIGKYIAEKRKALGLTQLQLAEKLNMSDKSVSKWERGVCLPDVSVYTKLCGTLGISLNEFLAGEDLTEMEIVTKSEETIISIATDSKRSRRRTNFLVLLLVTITLLLFSMVAGPFANAFDEDQDGFFDGGIVLLPEDSAEALMANRLRGKDVDLYRYNMSEEDDHIQMRCYWYKDGKRINEDIILDYSFEGEHTGEGMIAMIDDQDAGSIEFKVLLEGDTYEYVNMAEYFDKLKFPPEGYDLPDWQETYNRSIYVPKTKMKKDWPNMEIGICVVAFDENPDMEITNTLGSTGFWPKARNYCPEIAEYDYAAYVTVKSWH